MPACKTQVDLASLFCVGNEWNLQGNVTAQGAQRDEWVMEGGHRLLLDRFASSGAACGFLRLVGDQWPKIRLGIAGGYRLITSSAGGWLAGPAGEEFYYWIPQPPMLRLINPNGQILREELADTSRLQITGSSAAFDFHIPAGFCFDVVVWQIPGKEKNLIAELEDFAPLEAQGFFLWGSHTSYRRPSDLYRHLIFGHVYEDRYAWPHKRKICSENDAHALYVVLSGLQRATAKKFYSHLQAQLLISVLARQSGDGGWHHGEWTDDMECHLRLNGSAVHLLLDSLHRCDDADVRKALGRAVRFISSYKDETRAGSWLLHDSLEMSMEAMKKSPFQWLPTRSLGKSPSNMLVLNTHLDSLILLDRYRQQTGDCQYDDLIDSAKAATGTLLGERPLEMLYGLFFKLVSFTLLPTETQKRLSLPVRALKRITGEWIVPNLFRITGRFPRLAMPGGFVGRAVGLRGLADAYHSINVMDLARYWRRFPEAALGGLLRDAVEFANKNDLQRHWGERNDKKYALGFWAEALYHLYSLAPDRQKLSDLAKTIILIEQFDVGLPPSLLGANAEAVSYDSRMGCLLLVDRALRTVNLSHPHSAEFLVVNPTGAARTISFITCGVPLVWEDERGEVIESIDGATIPAGGWVVGRGSENSTRVTQEALLFS